MLFIDELHTVVGAGAAEGVDGRRRTCSSRCWRAASCTRSARPRSTSTASTSRRTPRSSAASSRCWSASRRSRTRSASCAACASATRSTTACSIKDAALVAAAVLSQPLHRRPVPARQGHRPGRRGGVAAAHGDRLDAGRARRGRAPRHAARDRARGAAQGDPTRRRATGSAEARAASWPTSRRPARGCAAQWQQEKDAIQGVRAQQGGARAGCGSRSSRPQRAGDYAQGVGAAVRPHSRSSSGRSASTSSAWPTRQRDRSMLKERSTRRTSPRSSARWTRHSRQPADGRRDAEARPHGGAPAPARRRPGRGGRRPWPTRSAARAPACRIPTGRSAASSSWARPASARPSWRARSPSSCSTTSTRWCASTCPSTRRSTPSRG